MLYREIIAVCSQIHTKHMELWNVKLAVLIVTTGSYQFHSSQYRSHYLGTRCIQHYYR